MMQIKELPPECFEYRFVRYETKNDPTELNTLTGEGWVPHEKVMVQQPMTAVIYLITFRRPREEFREPVIIEPKAQRICPICKRICNAGNICGVCDGLRADK